MSPKTVGDAQSKTLQSRLNAAIESRVLLEEDFKAQSSMLIEFINKLSQVSKGIDVKLDNRLAQLRGLFTRSAHISDIELKVDEISKLLQKHTVANEKNIEKLHTQFNNSGQNLQKAKGLPNELRRNLRELLSEAQSTKESITQYAPLFSQLLDFYNAALQSKSNVQGDNLKTEPLAQSNTESTTDATTVNSELIKKISSSLNQLTLSTQHTKELLEINKKLLKDTTHDGVLQHFIEIFDVIAADLQNERNNAKSFLNTLSKTLTTVQHAVKETLSTCEEAQNSNDKINLKLQEQLLDMSGAVKKALSLEDVKLDINGKLNNIAKTLEHKASLEQQESRSIN